MKETNNDELRRLEAECLEAVKQGNREAYSFIVRSYMRKAYYIALGFVKSEEDALDVSQDAFIKAYKYIDKFKSGSPFFPWFYRILKNRCLDWIKGNKNLSRTPIEDLHLASPEDMDDQVKMELWKSIEKLSVDHREIIILRYFHDYSYKEIAEIIEKPLGTVMSGLYYAKKRLRENMERCLK